MPQYYVEESGRREAFEVIWSGDMPITQEVEDKAGRKATIVVKGALVGPRCSGPDLRWEELDTGRVGLPKGFHRRSLKKREGHWKEQESRALPLFDGVI